MQMVLLTALGIGGATIIGAAIGFCVKNVSHKVNDMILSFAAGIMLAAAVNGLIAPAFELVGGAKIAIPVIGIFMGALFLNFMDKVPSWRTFGTKTIRRAFGRRWQGIFPIGKLAAFG